MSTIQGLAALKSMYHAQDNTGEVETPNNLGRHKNLFFHTLGTWLGQQLTALGTSKGKRVAQVEEYNESSR